MKRFLPLIIAVCACLLPLFFPSCANTTQAPSGGKKDTIPPYIIDIKPLPRTVGVPVKGVTFAANGTVAVVGNVDLGKTTSMPMAFESVSDLANVSSWTPWVNGVEKRKMRVKASASGLLLCPAGITVSFR